MRYFLALLCSFFLVGNAAHGQTTTAQEGDNTVVVSLIAGSSPTAWQQLGRGLVAQGFAIVASDVTMGTFVACRSGNFKPSYYEPSILLTGSMAGNILTIRGYAGGNNYNQLLADGVAIVFSQRSSGADRRRWETLVSAAALLQGRISYTH